VVFDGLDSKDKLRQIVFLSKRVENDWLNSLRSSVQKAVEQKNYNWQVARVSVDGAIEMADK
jgi:predicted Holliday junction resolvase-like endonuclease